MKMENGEVDRRSFSRKTWASGHEVHLGGSAPIVARSCSHSRPGELMEGAARGSSSLIGLSGQHYLP